MYSNQFSVHQSLSWTSNPTVESIHGSFAIRIRLRRVVFNLTRDESVLFALNGSNANPRTALRALNRKVAILGTACAFDSVGLRGNRELVCHHLSVPSVSYGGCYETNCIWPSYRWALDCSLARNRKCERSQQIGRTNRTNTGFRSCGAYRRTRQTTTGYCIEVCSHRQPSKVPG